MAQQPLSETNISKSQLPAYRSIALRLPFFFIITLVGIAIIAAVSISLIIRSRTEELVQSNLYAIANSESRQIEQLLETEIAYVESIALNETLLEELRLSNKEFEENELRIAGLKEIRAESWARNIGITSVDPLLTMVVNEFYNNNVSTELRRQNLPGLIGKNGLIVVNRHGAIVGATYIPQQYDYAESDWVQALEKGDPIFFVGRHIDKHTPAVDITDIAVPILDKRSGEPLGYVRGIFDFDNIQDILRNGRFDQSGRTVLLDNNGRLLYTIPHNNSLIPYRIPINQAENAEEEENQTLLEFTEEGEPYLATAVDLYLAQNPTLKNDWTVVAVQPTSEAFAPINSAILPTIYTSAVFSLLAVAILYTFYIRPLTSDLNLLQEKAFQLQESVNTQPVQLNREDELGILAHTFNQMAARMRHELYTREQVIHERTGILQKRTTQLEASVVVGREANASLNLDQLMKATVELIRDSSNYYHASIFLIDEKGEYAVVRESTGQVGQILKSNPHKLAVGSNSIVGQATKTRAPFLARNVGEEFRYFDNPLLPETKSEVALPLIAQGELLGVLDVQSQHIDAFTTEDLNVLQLMADQVAAAIYNARLFSNTLERAQQQRQVIQLWKRLEQLHSIPAVLNLVCQELVNVFGFDGAYISEIDGHELIIRAAAAQPDYPVATLGIRRPVDLGVYKEIIQNHSSVLTKAKQPNDPGHYDTSLPRALSDILVPVIVGKQVAYLLTVYSPQANALGENDETLLQLLAEAISSTIANTQLLAEKDQNLSELNRLYQQIVYSTDLTSSYTNVESVADETDTPTKTETHIIPLVVRDQTIGEISIESAVDLSDDQESLIQAVADQTAFALENSRLFAQTQLRLREQEALYNLTSHLTSTLDEQEIYRRATEAFVKQLQANHCMLAIWEKQQNALIVRAEYINDKSDPTFTGHYTRFELRHLADYPTSAAVLEHRSTIIRTLNDATLSPIERRNLQETQQAKSLEVPLFSGDLVLGTVSLLRDTTQPDFNTVDIKLAQAMATQTAVALQNALLTTRARTQISQLSALNRISRHLTVAASLREIYEITRMEVLNLTSATGISIMLVTDNKVKWAYAYENGAENDVSTVPLQKFGVGLTGHVLKTRDALHLTKNSNLEQFLVSTGSFSIGQEPNAWLGVPMIAADKLLGAIAIESENVHAFDDRDVQLMSTIASTVGIAVNNLQQFDELKHERATAQSLYTIGRNIATANSAEEILAALSILPMLNDVKGMAIILFELTASQVDTPALQIHAGWEAEGHKLHPLITPGYELSLEEQPFLLHLAIDTPFLQNIVPDNIELGDFVTAYNIHHIAAFPLVVGQSWLGYLALYAQKEQAYSGEQLRNLTSLIGQISVIVQNERLLTQTQEALAAQERQSLQLQTAAAVAAAASSSSLRELYTLMQNSVDLIKERFDLYYVGIFLLDEKEEYATLAAGTGAEGRAQIARQHQLKIGGRSLVGGAVADGEPRIHQNVYEAADWFHNPNLPDTRSEIALPLKVRDRIIGALTVQSVEPYMFPPEFVSALQTMTDQIAIAIDNADLFNQIQRNLLQTAALYETGRQLTEADSEYEVYQTMIKFIEKSKGFDAAYVITADPTSTIHRYIPIIWNLEDPPDLPNPRRVRATNLIPSRSETSTYLIIPDVLQSAYFANSQMRSIFEVNNIRSCSMLRIFINNMWIASLALLRRTDQTPTAKDLQPYIALADQAAVILSNQRLLKETSALYRLGRSLSSAMTPEDVARVTIEEIVAYTNVEQSRVIFFNEGINQAEIMAEYKPNNDPAKFIDAADVLQSMREQFLANRRPLIVEDNESVEPSEIVKVFLRPFGIRISLILPAYSQDSVLGFITLDSFQGKQQFTETVINFAQVAVDQFTTTIENIIFFDDALRRAQELITLNQISSRISATLDTAEIGEIVFNEVHNLIKNDVFILAEYAAVENAYKPILFAYQDKPLPLASQGPQKINLTSQLAHVLYEGEMVVLNRATPLTGELYEMVRGSDESMPASTIMIPLRQEGEPIGFLAVQNNKASAYTAEEINLLRSISNQTVLGLSNAHALQETKENVTELRTLFNVTQSIASSIDARDRIERMIETLYHSLRNANIAILSFDETHAALEVIAHRGRPMANRWVQLVEESLIDKAIKYGTPMLVNDLRELESYKPQDNATLAQIAVPLIFGQYTIGVINVESSQTNSFTERDLRLLQTLSVSLAATIESGRLFQEIQAANEQLLELDRMKTQFLANMSHELRTPLNSIIGFSRLILKGIDGPITSLQEEDLNSIYNSGQHLLNLINDILDLAKIDAGKMALVFDKVNLNDLCQSVLSTARGLVKDESIALNWEIEPELPLIEADPVRLRQILLNLLSNAAKFTDEGRISLAVQQTDHNEILITVEDTGIGIASKDFPKLFKAFEQVDDSPSRAVDGTGLGLPIVHELVQLHHGSIWFDSEVGKGSTFYINLPITQTIITDKYQDSSTVVTNKNGVHNSETRVNGHKRPQSSSAILLVDDEPGILTLYQRYLNAQPYELICVENGLAALEELNKRPEEIALVVMDVYMPGLTGWEVLRQIKSNPILKDTRVVLCSVEENQQQALESGAYKMLPKPIIADDLLKVIDDITKLTNQK